MENVLLHPKAALYGFSFWHKKEIENLPVINFLMKPFENYRGEISRL